MTRRTLRFHLMALVLTNIAFIHITGVLSPAFLLPLYGLTLLAPWFVRFHERVPYHLIWNLAILFFLSWLVWDAQRRGIAYLLDHGMFLAGACQVHLVNNLRERQKPDLTFLNSFLIAIVTSHFCQDVSFLFVFVPYAFVFTTSLVVAALQEAPDASEGTSGSWGSHVLRFGWLMGGTALVFFAWPRSFDRPGFLADSIDLAARQGAAAGTGYTNTVMLERPRLDASSPRVVFRVRVVEGEVDVPLYWRGGTCSAFDGTTWLPEDPPPKAVGFLERAAWSASGDGYWERSTEPFVARLEVSMESLVAERLFLPETTLRVERLEGSLQRPDGTIGWRTRRATGRTYRLDVGRSPPGEGPRRIQPEVLERYLLLERSRLPTNLILTAETWRRERPVSLRGRALVEHLRQRVANLGPYRFPGDPDASNDLAQFVDGSGGHCEFFASALAAFLRLEEIPCRLVTGFVANEWGDGPKERIVRERNAHAWLEVFDSETGWYIVDPTPAVPGEGGPMGTSWFDRGLAWFSALWNDLLSFDSDTRANWMEGLLSLPARLHAASARDPGAFLLVALFLFALLCLRRLRDRGHEPVAVRRYRRALARARVTPMTGETPRATLERVLRETELSPNLRTLLDQATRDHERERYARSARVSTGRV